MYPPGYEKLFKKRLIQPYSDSLVVSDKKVYLARLRIHSNNFICADDINLYYNTKLGNLSVVTNHCVKSVQIRSFFLIRIFPYSD